LANRGKPIKYQSGIKEKLWSIGWNSAGNRSLFSSQESQSGSTCSTVPTNWIPDRGGIQHCHYLKRSQHDLKQSTLEKT
jgi:hypothetical protein